MDNQLQCEFPIKALKHRERDESTTSTAECCYFDVFGTFDEKRINVFDMASRGNLAKLFENNRFFCTLFTWKYIEYLSCCHLGKAPSTRIRIFSNPQLFRCGYGYRPHVYGEFDSESVKK